MRSLLASVALLAPLAGCHLAARGAPALPPLTDEGEVWVYLEAFPPEAARLSFELASVTVRREGVELPLELGVSALAGPEMNRQRLLAFGRLPPGDYPELLLRVKRAKLTGDDAPADLLVSAEPTRVAVPLAVSRGRASVLSLRLQFARSIDRSFAFAPDFTAAVAGVPAPEVVGLCSNTRLADLTVFDKRNRRGVGAVPVGREPLGLALDVNRNRAYVVLSGDDEVEVLDLITGAYVGRISLRRGDQPRELALMPDGRLLVVNSGSNSVAFLDPNAMAEVDRAVAGEEPWTVDLDRSGRRAFVLNRRFNQLTVVDLANRKVAQTIPTDPEPLRAQTSRAGDRLYLIHGGSAYMTVYSLPDLRVQKRVFVGLGAGALKVDSRTDLIYVGRRDTGEIQVFDPFSLMPLDTIALPGPVSYLAIDDVENALVALLPDQRAVAFVDLTRRRLTGLLDVGDDPYFVTLFAERF